MNYPALIMAGGRSERMRAGGCKLHKALRAVCGAPLIEHNLEMLLRFDVNRIWVAVNNTEADLICWLKSRGQNLAADFAAELNIIVEYEPQGTMGSARCLKDLADNVLITNVDNLTGLDLNALVECQLENEAALTVASHNEPFRIPFGEIQSEGARLVAYREKPSFNVLVSSGTYVVHNRALSCISETSPTSAPSLVQCLLDMQERVACFEHDAWWIDVNDEPALVRAEMLLERHARLHPV